MKTEEERDFDALTDKNIWQEAAERLKICEDAEDDNRRRAKDCVQFREGMQWDDDTSTTVSQESIELTINLTDAMVTRVENNIRQQMPRGKVHPVGDGADIEIAEIINGIGRHVETRSEASVAYDTAASSAITGGFGYFRIIAEYLDEKSFKKDLRILPIRNVFTVSMDPGSIMPSGADQVWCIISSKMKRTEYRRRYPNSDAADWSDTGRDSLRREWEGKEEIRLAEYFRIREISEKLYLIKGRNGEEFTKFRSEMPKDPETGKMMSVEKLTPILGAKGLWIAGERQSSKRQIEWFRLNGTKVIERQRIPGRYIPVFRVEGKAADMDGKIRRRGMVESMMDPARMVNYGEVAKIKRLGLTPKAPWVAAEGQTEDHPEWATSNNENHPVLIYKPVTVATAQGDMVLPPPERLEPAQIEQGFSEFVQGMRSNLMAVAGMPNEPGQDEKGVVVSGRAIQRRQYLSDQAHFQYYDNLTMAIAQCWRVITDWVPHYYNEPGRIQRIIGDDSTPQMVTLNQPDDEAENRIKNDMSLGTYDVVMDTGPGYETKREEGAENLMEMLKVQALAEIIAKQAPDLVFRSIDHPYMQELADRLMAATPDGLKKVMEGLSSKAKSLVQYLSNENSQLQQQVQQLQADLKYGITKTHLQETVKAHDIEEENRTKRFDVITKAQTARDIEEIRAGAKLLDSGAARGHEAALAVQDMMHAATQAELDRQFQSSESMADRLAAQAGNGEQNGNNSSGQQ